MRKCYCGQQCLGCVFGVPESMVDDWSPEYLTPTAEATDSMQPVRGVADGINNTPQLNPKSFAPRLDAASRN
jgi:hypothetical protein